MHSVKVLSAITAFTGLASAATTCTRDVRISQPTPVIDCDVIDADVIVDTSVAGDLSIEGPKQLKGDLTITNATQLLSISSSTINAIGGTFELNGLTLLSSFQMSALRSLNKINMINLPQLPGVTFGSDGVTSASSVVISDTFISDLSGLSLATVDTFQIDNNNKLTSFNSDLTNITTSLIINNNGNNFIINMTKLRTANEIELSDIKGFDAPALHTVTGSLRFTSNPQLSEFSARNLTTVTDSITFNKNNKLTNVTFPQLTRISGDLTILNNTALEELDGFPKLATVGGAILLGGSFEKVELPALKDVKGSVRVTSTTSIKDFCKAFDDASSSGAIQGPETCTSNNEGANEGSDGGDSGSSTSSSSDSSSTDSSLAGMNNVNFALLGLAGVAAIAQLM